MTVVTRFAPSPTGFLHIGSVRTALFNWLFARHHGGVFRLRIEDTDRARSTEENVQAILTGLSWLGLDWDGEEISQFTRRDRHAAIAHRLLEQGRAYHCYCTPDELAAMREQARAEGRPTRYDGRWRDRDPAEAPEGVPPVVRLKAPQSGATEIADVVQGAVTVENEQLDDMVLLRADGTPTYMLSVVIDDVDMGITHVIRGDDHLTNAFRQVQLYNAMDVVPPVFAHIPLIHGPDGSKLSKRHGAVGIEAYRDMGYLPEALCNYLLRLGWAHGDEEIISRDQAIAWFDLNGVGRSAARFDKAKLDHLSAHYLRQADAQRLADLAGQRIESTLGRALGPEDRNRLLKGLDGLRQRAKTVSELSEMAMFFVLARPIALNDKAQEILTSDARATLTTLAGRLEALTTWAEEEIEAAVREMAEVSGVKLGQIAQPLRAALSGSNVSPGIFEVAAILGREETLGRISDVTDKVD